MTVTVQVSDVGTCRFKLVLKLVRDYETNEWGFYLGTEYLDASSRVSNNISGKVN